MRFPIGGKRWSKLTNPLGKLQIAPLTRTRDRVVLLENEANLCASRRQVTFFRFCFFLSLSVGGITKHLMTGPSGNREF